MALAVRGSDLLDLRLEAQVHPVFAVQVGEHFADRLAECGQQRLFGGLDDGDVDAALTSARGHLQADPTGAHHRQ